MNRKRDTRWRSASLAVCLVLGSLAAADAQDRQKGGPKVRRARRTVKMLDDVYKTTVVLITETYVKDENSFPAGAAAVALFEAIEKKGWHKVRLIDVAGEPIDDDNTAKDDFEKNAVTQLKAGKTFVETVETRDGKQIYRAATPIPVVSKKCVMCHPNYADAKKGAPIGLLSYALELEKQ